MRVFRLMNLRKSETHGKTAGDACFDEIVHLDRGGRREASTRSGSGRPAVPGRIVHLLRIRKSISVKRLHSVEQAEDRKLARRAVVRHGPRETDLCIHADHGALHCACDPRVPCRLSLRSVFSWV